MHDKLNIVEKDIRLESEESSHFDAKHEPIYEKEDASEEGIEWYKKWRRDNL
jgi:hypothetical protein